jgi:hypothetical protein
MRTLIVAAMTVILLPCVARAGTVLSPTTIPLALAQMPAPVETVSIDLPGYGYVKVNIMARTPEQWERAQKFLDQLQHPDAPRVYSRYAGSEWDDGMMLPSYASMIEAACAAIGVAAQMQGGMNIWFDAAGALCLSVSIVTLGQQLGQWVWHQYMVSVAKQWVSSPAVVTAVVYGGMITP